MGAQIIDGRALAEAFRSDAAERAAVLREAGTPAKLDAVLVDRALAALAEPDRALVRRAFFYGASHSELARELDIPLGTVKSRLRRVLQ